MRLPVDVFIHIMSFLPVCEIASAMTVSTKWNAALADAHSVWASVHLNIVPQCDRITRVVDAIARRSGSIPLSLHLTRAITEHPPNMDFARLPRIRTVERVMHRLRCLSISDGLFSWNRALSSGAPYLEVLHLRAPFRRQERWNPAWLSNGTFSNLREVYLERIQPVGRHATFPSVVLASLFMDVDEPESWMRTFESFPKVQELRWILQLDSSYYASHDSLDTRAISVPTTLKRVYITEYVSMRCIRELFGHIDDLVVAFVINWQRSRGDHLRAEASAYAILSLTSATVLQVGWYRGLCAKSGDMSEGVLHDVPSALWDLTSTYAYISLDGHCVGVDISSTRLNLVLRQWADKSALEHVQSLHLPISIWHRVVIAGIALPQLHTLTLVFSAGCRHMAPYPQSHHNFLTNSGPVIASSSDVHCTSFTDDDGLIEYSDDETSPTDHLLSEQTQSQIASSSITTQLDVDKDKPYAHSSWSHPLSPPGIVDADQAMSPFSMIGPPVSPLSLEVLRLERSDGAAAATELPEEPLIQFLEQLLPVAHRLRRLELGGGFSLPDSGHERMKKHAEVVKSDHFQLPLPKACRPWYFQTPHHYD